MQGSADANRDGEEKTRQHRPTQKGWDVLRIWGLGWGLGWDVCLSALSHWPSTGKKRLELVLPIIRDTSFRGSVACLHLRESARERCGQKSLGFT
jgi:hypothetical protein